MSTSLVLRRPVEAPADLQLCCSQCGMDFWWLGREQLQDEEAPSQCKNCRRRASGRARTYFCEDCRQWVPKKRILFGHFWQPRCSSCLIYRCNPEFARRNQATLPQAIYNDLQSGLLDEEHEQYLEWAEAQGWDEADDDGQDVDDPIDRPFVPEPALRLAEPPSYMAELPTNVVTPDIDRLIQEAFSDFEDRRRTFIEWLRRVDLRGKQMADKLRSAQDAQTLIRERHNLINQLSSLFESTTALRQRQLNAYLEELNLREQIAEKLLLTGPRLETQRALEIAKQRRLLEAPPAPPALRSRREQIVDEHIEDRSTRSGAQRAVLNQCRAEVREIMDGDLEDEEAAFEIRSVLEAYRLPETALQKRVRQFLSTTDREEES